jgi:hypothetical protein
MGDIIAARRRQAQASKSNRIERVREKGPSVTEPQRKPIESFFSDFVFYFSLWLWG